VLLQRHKSWVFYIPTLIMGFSPFRWFFLCHIPEMIFNY
jgi:hypothetical protein